MAEREQARRSKEPERKEDEENVVAEERPSDQKLDELLDEIDQVLEENAEEFVRNYIQKGGE